MKELEIWKDIVGYEGYYQVSNMGNVRSVDRITVVVQARYKLPRRILRKGKQLKAYFNGTGRQMVILYGKGKPANVAVHRLVAEHFLDNPSNRPVVNHLNSNHRDNRATNLEWCTYEENTRHAINAGRMGHIFQPNKRNAKITNSQAMRAKELLLLGWTNSKVAEEIGSSYDTIYHLAAGHTWKHI